MSHQTNPVRLIRVEVIHNVPILHQLRNNRERFISKVDVDTEKLQNIRMASVHPKHGLPAEVLYSGFHVPWQDRNRTVMEVPTFRIFGKLLSCATLIVFTATALLASIPFRTSANPPQAKIASST